MVIDILLHTPGWVWLVLATLVGLGLSQARTRDASAARVAAVPVAMVSLSIAGVLSTFGPSLLVLASWAVGVALAVAFGRRAVAVRGACWLPATRRVRMPGSWLPLGLMLAIFALKYATGVGLGLHPALATDPTVEAVLSVAFGVSSGLFLARAWSLRGVIRAGRGGLQPA